MQICSSITDVPKWVAKNWKWAAVVVIAIIVTSILWLISKEKLTEPEIPSIAVLPFVNMSNDPEQDYFIDGMTDELINDLTTSVYRYQFPCMRIQ